MTRSLIALPTHAAKPKFLTRLLPRSTTMPLMMTLVEQAGRSQSYCCNDHMPHLWATLGLVIPLEPTRQRVSWHSKGWGHQGHCKSSMDPPDQRHTVPSQHSQPCTVGQDRPVPNVGRSGCILVDRGCRWFGSHTDKLGLYHQILFRQHFSPGCTMS